VTALCDNADQLLELIPEESPPAGFELRVLDAVARVFTLELPRRRTT
jgi:hypothetical protein